MAVDCIQYLLGLVMADWHDSVRQLEHVYRVFDTHKYDSAHESCNQWKSYKHKSTKQGLEFSLTRVQFVDLVTDSCFYCTSAPKPTHGIDRVDNTRGYVTGNVVTCCHRCNIAKNDQTLDEFQSWAIRAGSNMFKWHSAQAFNR